MKLTKIFQATEPMYMLEEEIYEKRPYILQPESQRAIGVH